MKKCARFLVLALVGAIVVPTVAAAEGIPTFITYQGRVTDSLGNPIADTEHDIVFTIYEDDVSSTVLWTSGTLSGTPTNGLFSTHLGPIPADVFTSGNQRYLGITVDSDPEMTPRVEITSMPYAYQSLIADTARYAFSAPASPDVDWTIDGNTIYHSPGNVGIGVSSPTEPLVVGSDLGAGFEGNYIVAGAPIIDFTCGFKLGLNNSNHSTVEWYGDGPPFAVHTRENGTSYNNTLVVRGGKIGINNTWPEEKLTIGPNLGDWYGDYISICNDDSAAGILFGQNNNNRCVIWRNQNGDVGFQNYMNGSLVAGISLDSNRVGIGNLTPEAALSVGDDVGTYYGTWLTIGDATTYETGVILGQNENNNCVITRNGSGHFQIFSEEGGTRYYGLNIYRTNAGVGMGTSMPTEKFVVGKNLGSFYGDRIVVGDDNPGTLTGLVFGEDNSNRGWMLWNVDDNYVNIGYKANGSTYDDRISFKNGNVGVKTANPSADFAVSGSICYTGSIGACSDARYKRDIHTLDHALDKVVRLRGVSFQWKQDDYPEKNFPDNEQIGLIAQEVKDVVPQVVSETNDGYYNVDYTKLTALLVEAVKELKAENEQLRARIDAMEKR